MRHQQVSFRLQSLAKEHRGSASPMTEKLISPQRHEGNREFYDRPSSFALVLSSVFLVSPWFVTLIEEPLNRLAADCRSVRAHDREIDFTTEAREAQRVLRSSKFVRFGSFLCVPPCLCGSCR